MKKKPFLAALPVAAAFTLVATFGLGTASAASPDGTTYTANLLPVALNTPSGAASGMFTLTLNGTEATVHETVTGLAAKIPTDVDTLNAVHIPTTFAGAAFPHVQHIHIGGEGKCPSASADANGDGAISTVEGHHAYGMVNTTLSVSGATDASTATDVTVAPSGGSFTYDRTFTLGQDTIDALKNGTAVVVVHGLDPATAPAATVSTPNSLGLVLPGETDPVALLATAPALCGAVHVEASQVTPTTTPTTATATTQPAQQMNAMPQGGVRTGGGATSGTEDGALFVLGGVLLAGAAIVLVARKRIITQR